MPLLNRIGRSTSIFIGITAPKPEHERRYGILILTLAILIALGSLTLFFLMTQMLLR